MTPSETALRQDADLDQQLADVLAEVAARLQAGQSVDLSEYVRRCPEHADRIEQLLPAMKTLAELGRSRSSVRSSVAGAAEPVGTVERELGDFRILREIGRGGMGVVYEAQQISLGRRVALKVLPFAAVLDPRHLQRFKNEAQAAAALEHPNIVNVHAVGCERGVHYYAMQFIDGQTLAQVIHQLREAAGAPGGTGILPVLSGGTGETPVLPATTPPDANQEVGWGEAKRSPSDEPEQPLGLRPSLRREPRTLNPEPSSPAPSPQPLAPSSSPLAPDTSPKAAISTQRSTRTPEFFRSVANLGIQAAEALEHAHQMGVVHRDIKPSNLMVDARGHLWITDFGLALTHTGANLTMTGDILGTLRYMSPEQAAGKSRVLDHHTDIYSLGLTLYELLTLRPAFEGDDRQRLLCQIVADDPPPPRQHNPSIPRDLETIVLKATAKEPSQRYATAQQMADDLRRFLDDRPIRARRPSLFHRAAKWSRRHRPVIWSAVASVFGGAAAVLLGIVFLVSTGKGTVKLEFADAEAVRQCTISIDGDEIRIENLGEPIKLRPGKHQLRIMLGDLEIETREFDVVRYDTQILHVSIANPPVKYALAPRVQERVLECVQQGEAYAEKGDFDKALALFSEANRLDPKRFDALGSLALLCLAAGRRDEYRSDCAALVEHYARTATPYIGALIALTCAWGPDAVADWSEVVALAERAQTQDPQLPRLQRALGNVLYRAGRFEEALQHLSEADRLTLEPSELGECSPAELWYFLAMAHHRLGHAEEAKRWLDKATAWADNAFAEYQSGTGAPRFTWSRRLLMKLFRAEAESILGVAKGPATQNEPTAGKEKPK